MNKQKWLSRKKLFLKYEDLDNLNENDEVLVSRVTIQSAYAIAQLNYQRNGKDGEKLDKLSAIHWRLRELDKKLYNEKKRIAYGIKMTVKEIKATFSKEDIHGAGLIRTSLPEQNNVNNTNNNNSNNSTSGKTM